MPGGLRYTVALPASGTVSLQVNVGKVIRIALWHHFCTSINWHINECLQENDKCTSLVKNSHSQPVMMSQYHKN